MSKLVKQVLALPLWSVFILVFVDQAQSQLSVQPGPPYADRWGNNRWGVKYDPRIHGRGRSQQSSPSSSGNWGGVRGRDVPEELPPTRFRSNNGGGPSAYPPRNKWIPGLKPLVSSFMKYRRRPRRGPLSNFDSPGDDMYRNPYSRRAIDGYVQNYMNHYNSVSQSRPYSSDFVNLQNYIRPTTNNNYGPREFQPSSYGYDRMENTPTSHMSVVMMRSDDSVDDNRRVDINKGSLKDSYLSLKSSGTTDTPRYRTIEPAHQQISKKSSVSFGRTLSKLYNDYKPGDENTGSAVVDGGIRSSSSSNNNNNNNNNRSSDSIGSSSTSFSDDSASIISSGDEIGSSFGSPFSDDDLTSPLPRHRPPSYPSRPRPRSRPPPGKRVPHYVEKPYLSRGIGGRPHSSSPPSRGRNSPPSYRGSSRPGGFSSGPLSSHDFYESGHTSSPPGGFPSTSPYDSFDYSDTPPTEYSSSGSFNDFPPPSRPMTVSTYSMSGPPHSPFSVDSSDTGHGPFSSSSPYTSAAGAPRYPPPITSALNPFLATSPMAFAPSFPSSPYLSPALVLSPDYYSTPQKEKNRHKRPKPIKRKKNRFQHTPMNLIRGLLGRDNQRKDNLRDRDPKMGEQDSYNPSYAINVPLTLPPPPQYSFNPVVNSLPSGGPPPPPLYNGYPHQLPPAGPPPPLSPISAGLSSLRDTLTGAPPPPSGYYRPPPPPRPNNGDIKKDNPSGSPNQDWPRIFTAMGSSVDAVAGGIHAVRKELSKATGQTLAKGIMMGGSAVHEVSKGMAHMIAKMSTL